MTFHKKSGMYQLWKWQVNRISESKYCWIPLLSSFVFTKCVQCNYIERKGRGNIHNFKRQSYILRVLQLLEEYCAHNCGKSNQILGFKDKLKTFQDISWRTQRQRNPEAAFFHKFYFTYICFSCQIKYSLF